MIDIVIPVALPARGVPLALRVALRCELDRLVQLEVIAAVDELAEWVSQIVVATEKSEAIRLYIDMKHSEESSLGH